MNPTVFYIEKQPCPELHQHILKHLPRMQFWYEWQGCELVYLPLHELESVQWESVKDYLTYQFPVLNQQEFKDVLGTLKEPAHLMVNRLLLHTQLQDAEGLAYLVYTDQELQNSSYPYQVLSAYGRGEITVEDFFQEGFAVLGKIQGVEQELYLYEETSDSQNFHQQVHFFTNFENLPEEVEPIIPAEIVAKLDALQEVGARAALLDIVVHILNNLSANLIGDREAVLEMLQKHWADYATVRRPSRMFIDRHTRIFLPDFGNLEIEMRPLPKTLFLFYLRHPEGVAFSHLCDYREEFREIYSKITNRSSPSQIEASVAALVNSLDNSANEKCARIKGAFFAQMHPSVAAPYLIEGPRGGLRRIKLDRSLVTYELQATGLQACNE